MLKYLVRGETPTPFTLENLPYAVVTAVVVLLSLLPVLLLYLPKTKKKMISLAGFEPMTVLQFVSVMYRVAHQKTKKMISLADSNCGPYILF
jgi:hypothetical protein